LSRKSGGAGLAAIILLAVLAIIGYAAFSADSVYQDLDGGRANLSAAQAALASGEKAADASQLQHAAANLRQAEHEFQQAQQRIAQDPALRAMNTLPWGSTQVEASAHLGGIGSHLSRAGQAATAVALQVVALERQYSGRSLTPDDLQTLLQRAQTIAASYKTAIDQIGRELKAAHTERAEVTTTDLIPPLHDAYDEVDAALAKADTTFIRYQDVRQVLADLLGVHLSG
jgi:hypothetical protein